MGNEYLMETDKKNCLMAGKNSGVLRTRNVVVMSQIFFSLTYFELIKHKVNLTCQRRLLSQ